jgi:GGDEF domain-containing protein
MLRRSDLLCEYQTGGLQYCILLPGATAEKASAIAARLAESLRGPIAERIAPARFQITTQDLHQKATAL